MFYTELDLVPYVVTLLASLVLDVAYGTLIGIGVDLLILLYPIARPSLKMDSTHQRNNLELSASNSLHSLQAGVSSLLPWSSYQ